ncbi:Fungal trichothecene efflux pump (TRI12) [Geosmithia morbida]|uniref:Fungal trichothecene efflux pump (TRI12) n=1 Tax=Geosmithia morbida TaxID=1094350 RepID=A0A9P4Z1G0_9HYPO|nr:Fungal trichothecene efflux pump (TRI12) [Geosmithia morbida]KAF4125533.1 Fungal trichothecene efflux pump (TRI12) [Geosmithia morbida]
MDDLPGPRQLFRTCLRRPGALPQGRVRTYLIFAFLNVLTLMNAFESTCLIVILPTIAVELNASVAQSLSFSSIFLTGMTLVQPLSGEISWVFGRRGAMLMALLTFAIGTTVCACAESPGLLLFARLIQ